MILKKTAAVVMAAAMMLASAANVGGGAIKASAAQEKTGICTYNYVDIRANADSTSRWIGWLDGGDNVEILEEKKDTSGRLWYKIAYNVSIIGYVPADSISVNKTNNSAGGDSTSYDASDYESYLEEQGFPESYKIYLRELHKQHPSWVFTAQHLNIDWNKAVSEETVIGRNLVHTGALDSWKSMEKGAYDFNTGEWYQLDTGWVAASEGIIKYYLDPRNFLSEQYIFMFENLSYDPKIHTIEGVEAILRDTFMDGDYTCPDTGEVYSYAQTFMDAAEVSGVSPYHLASRCRNEQGVYGAPQSLGTVKGYENYFNFFDVQAYATSTMTAGQMAARYASTTNEKYLLPWTNQNKSIVGGSIFLGTGYITKEQDTLYLQKFDMTDGGNGYFVHQYMTCVFGQANEAVSMLNAYSDEVLASAMEFKIPIYTNMPDTLCPKPESAWDNNDYLSSLSVSGATLSPAFNKYTQSYTATVSAEADSVTISAKAYGANSGVYGTGAVVLKEGKNVVNVTCVSPGGTKRVYSISIDKPSAPQEEPPAKALVGDVNDDNLVNAVDVMMVISSISGRITLDSSQRARADVNGDGIVNIADAMLVINIMKGYEI